MGENIVIPTYLIEYGMYATAISTYLLRFLIPTPEEFQSIFGIKIAPKLYLVFYNLLRWIAGNRSWVVGGEARKTIAQETTDLSGTKTITTLTTEKVMDQDERKPAEPTI